MTAILSVGGITGAFASASVMPATQSAWPDTAAEDTAAAAAAAVDERAVSLGAERAAIAGSVARVQARALAAATYTVRTGDSLSAVAQRRCGAERDWTGIYAASRAAHLTSRDANEIEHGQHLVISCRYVPDALRFAPAPLPAIRTAALMRPYAAPAEAAAAPAASVSVSGYSGIEACIVSRESGGNSQVMNSSGHYGLFQFDYGTWVSGGGSGADFGHASVAEQDQVFASVYAARGAEPWSASDGC